MTRLKLTITLRSDWKSALRTAATKAADGKVGVREFARQLAEGTQPTGPSS